eukprot:3747887-Amphidinium_carterae.1
MLSRWFARFAFGAVRGWKGELAQLGRMTLNALLCPVFANRDSSPALRLLCCDSCRSSILWKAMVAEMTSHKIVVSLCGIVSRRYWATNDPFHPHAVLTALKDAYLQSLCQEGPASALTAQALKRCPREVQRLLLATSEPGDQDSKDRYGYGRTVCHRSEAISFVFA